MEIKFYYCLFHLVNCPVNYFITTYLSLWHKSPAGIFNFPFKYHLLTFIVYCGHRVVFYLSTLWLDSFYLPQMVGLPIYQSCLVKMFKVSTGYAYLTWTLSRVSIHSLKKIELNCFLIIICSKIST